MKINYALLLFAIYMGIVFCKLDNIEGKVDSIKAKTAVTVSTAPSTHGK
jgi:hypothetical protein